MPEEPEADASLGPNAWLADDMYEQYRQDPSSVNESWQEFFADYHQGGPGRRPTNGGVVAGPAAAAAVPQAASATPAPAPIAPAAPVVSAPPSVDRSVGTPIRGAASRIVANMQASLSVPTATSFRLVPARLLEVNRQVLNNQLARVGAGKVSFTHMIGYAVLKALKAVPVMNSTFVPAADGD
ncbi:MAG TPA: 2-oxo acid dehydrogenase subunit E2, partial [Acidimicrobiales bacterium]|nr:2-oxo acid dehydrogenase subunit E2 [Acidimicrobiales bacterium]